MDVSPRTLELMALCRTRYEVALVIDGTSRIVGYTSRRTRESLFRYIQAHRAAIVRKIGDPESAWFEPFKDRIEINGGDVVISFTGRTERDARVELDRNNPIEAAA